MAGRVPVHLAAGQLNRKLADPLGGSSGLAADAVLVSAEVYGGAELAAAMLRLKATLRKRIMQKALRAAFQPLLKELRATAPRGKGKDVRGKHLKNTLKLRNLRRSRVRTGVRIFTGTPAELGIPKSKGTNPKKAGYYPAHGELGTKHQRARPWMRPALAKLRGSIQDHLGRLVWEAMAVEVAREEKRVAKANAAKLAKFVAKRGAVSHRSAG